MRKEIYLIKGSEGENYQSFTERILLLAGELKSRNEVTKIKLGYTSEPAPKISVIPFKKEKIAAVSVYSEKVTERGLFFNSPGFSGGYEVEEAIPVGYQKNWDDGETTPGVCLLTLFRQKPGLDYKTFIHSWHNGHTPLSLKIHPLWNYNRNVVTEKLTDSSFAWDGVVEEHFRSTSDLLNPLKFFGNPLTMVFNMLRVYFDTNSFLDYKTIEPYFATEIHIKS